MDINYEEFIGKKFGKRTVITFVNKRNKHGVHAWCRCECGKESFVVLSDLRNGRRIGCNSCQHLKHSGVLSGKKTRLYSAWCAMRSRCYTKGNIRYHRYGGRGIKVCNRWNDFANFSIDMGEPPEGATLDRMDVNGNYEPSNCRWAFSQEQSENKVNSVRIKYNGRVRSIPEVSALINVHPATIYNRYRRRGKLIYPNTAKLQADTVKVDSAKGKR